MADILSYLKREELAESLSAAEAESLVPDLGRLSGTQVYVRSIVAIGHSLLFLGRREGEKLLCILSGGGTLANRFQGSRDTVQLDGTQMSLTVAPADAANAVALRTVLPFLVAKPLGLQKSAGCGDRLGLATPGHIRAFRSSFGTGAGMAPILAQQSIRENVRTGRTPQEVLDDAMWGAFQEGWRAGFGADADHLKTTDDVDICAAAGYTFYTIDPGEHVDDRANRAAAGELAAMVAALPWDVLESSPEDLADRLANKTIDLGKFSLTLTEEEVQRAAAKYGRAVAHTVRMYRHLSVVMEERPFELEMSVDETETVTTLAEHVYIAGELKRLGVVWVSLAPRYVGTFEKGVDYIGDLERFEESFARHMAVARVYGPYKLSLHSGSDKFSIYPIAARLAGDLVHLKTAGTSYLEALRAIAAINPDLFRQIARFALERYPTDRASYHVSAQATKVPDVDRLPDEGLAALLDDFHGREVLHVTFGSVLNHQPFREPFFAALRDHEETYYRLLQVHFHKHFAPFV